MELSHFSIDSLHQLEEPTMADMLTDHPYRYVTSEDRERERKSREYEHSICESMDEPAEEVMDMTHPPIQPDLIPPNTLTPRQQEEADQPVREGMRYLFENKFMRAKLIFQSRADSEPLSSLGLGAMAFIRGLMTHHEQDIHVAMDALQTTYTIAQAQIANTNKKTTPTLISFTRYFGDQSPPDFTINSILRAHVIKAEASLMIAILQLFTSTVLGYLKCGFYARRAYYSYQLVWNEYKRMGQEYTKHMDRDTVSGIQFGMGAVQLLLASLPSKIVKLNAMVGWTCDKELGFVLLKLCIESNGIRSSLASLVLLAYYNILTSFAPQLYGQAMMEPALDCLSNAQHQQPRSSFFLYFAARFARSAHNLALSSQTFYYTSETSQGEQPIRQLVDHEQGMNEALQLNWEACATFFENQTWWSPAFSKYMVGACYEMMGNRTEAILAFAQVQGLAVQSHSIDGWLLKKVSRYQDSGYQDLDLSLPILEILLVLNMFEWMQKDCVEQCLGLVENALERVYERERIDHGVRQKTLLPATRSPNYHYQRAVLLLIQSALLNASRQSQQAVAHLNWILDHPALFKSDPWLGPFTFWESGVACWHLDQAHKSRRLWTQALAYSGYDFEYRMSIRLSLALNQCDVLGIQNLKLKVVSHGRKRMPLRSMS